MWRGPPAPARRRARREGLSPRGEGRRGNHRRAFFERRHEVLGDVRRLLEPLRRRLLAADGNGLSTLYLYVHSCTLYFTRSATSPLSPLKARTRSTFGPGVRTRSYCVCVPAVLVRGPGVTLRGRPAESRRFQIERLHRGPVLVLTITLYSRPLYTSLRL